MYTFLSATIIIHACIVSALTAFPMPRLFPLGRIFPKDLRFRKRLIEIC